MQKKVYLLTLVTNAAMKPFRRYYKILSQTILTLKTLYSITKELYG